MNIPLGIFETRSTFAFVQLVNGTISLLIRN